MSDTPRERFNDLVHEFGLQVIETTTDGWIKSCIRDDGLYLWRIATMSGGIGIQTAYLVNVSFQYHIPYFEENYEEALKLAMRRDHRE